MPLAVLQHQTRQFTELVTVESIRGNPKWALCSVLAGHLTHAALRVRTQLRDRVAGLNGGLFNGCLEEVVELPGA